MKIIWSPLFIKKLKIIVDFISMDNRDAAFALVDDIEKRVAHLAMFPVEGRLIQSANDEMIRELVIHKNYIIVYAFKAKNVELITIRHTRQKPKTP
jgi:addiction module RelE/StbE family toxin